MADLDKFETNPQAQLLEHIKDVRCVMLGTPLTDAHMQPMSPFVCLEDGFVFFYADKTSHLASSVASQTGFTHMCLVESDYQACVKGHLVIHDNPDTIERFWSPVVDAWFPGGKTDPNLTMLKFVPHDASIWASSKNVLTFAYEIAKANLTSEKPDVGEQKHVRLETA